MSDSEQPKQLGIECKLCKIFCSSALVLSSHVMGSKHMATVQRDCPEELPQLLKLQYFLDTFIPQEPLVGLQYVEEVQLNCGYRYRCALCCFDDVRKRVFAHLTGAGHIACFLETHAPELSVWPSRFPHKKLYVKALQQASAQYCMRHGREKIKVTDVPDCQTAAAAGLHGNIHSKSRRNRRKYKCCEPPSEFTDNGDFLDYLGKFEIRNAEDAGVLKQILENCTQAVKRFCAEQAPQNQPWEELPGNPQGVADEADKDSPAVNSGSSVGQVASAPVPETDPLQLFFSSIKNMEESEVVGILHSIAATNPAFRGLSVPNTIRYLQATGRLKPS